MVSVGIVVRPTQYYVTSSSGVRAFRSANVGENRIIDRDWVYLSAFGHSKNSKSILRVGDVLVVRSGAPGTACVVTEEFAGSNCIDVVFARPLRSHVLPEYLAEFTNSAVGKKHTTDSLGGLALQHFNVGAYKRLKLLLPPLRIQQLIVDRLAAWERGVLLSERLIAAKQRNYEAQVSRLIDRCKFPVSKVGAIACEVSERNKNGNDARVLSVTNSRGFILPEERFERRIASADLSNYKIVQPRQYAYNPSRINVGSVARLESSTSGVLSPMYVVFGLDETKVNSDYFLHWLTSNRAKEDIKRSVQGTVRESVSFADFGALKIPLPSITIQTDISKYLDALRNEIRLLTTCAEAIRVQKRGLLQRLLTGTLRVPDRSERETPNA